MMKRRLIARAQLRLVGCLIVTSGLMIGLLAGSGMAGEILIKSGDRIAFMGDSITSAGWDSPTGYVRLVVSALQTNGIDVQPIPAGVSGNKSNDMLNRLDVDVIQKKPDWLTLSSGVNDVWHYPGGIALDEYKRNITQIVDTAQAAGIRVVILTATMIGEDQSNANNQKLVAYNAFLRELAGQRHLPLADLSALMQQQIAQEISEGWTPGHLLTMDGVHMNPRGNALMATGVLQAIGLDNEQIAKARQVWMDIPNGWSAELSYQVKITRSLTLRQYMALQETAPKESAGGVLELLEKLYRDDFVGVLSPQGQAGLDALKNRLEQKLDQDIHERLQQ
ncbi:MAG: SGNH/GDSL hydrolase family protein [Phycisphaerales bacterium]|nr:SGNH/GDSL hydrolase family protein [Phycisphaerales bacterium]